METIIIDGPKHPDLFGGETPIKESVTYDLNDWTPCFGGIPWNTDRPCNLRFIAVHKDCEIPTDFEEVLWGDAREAGVNPESMILEAMRVYGEIQ